ncbi:MAG: protein kinase domain-containing protein [Myxococcales bacterium]|jgi:serine/threonine protein kinase
MNFLCPACRTPLPHAAADAVVPCTQCGIPIDLTRLDTSPGTARLWPDVDLTGETLGNYRLVKRLASGGMGIVYEAETESVLPGQKRCAVKVLGAMLAADPALRKRFAREAAALRALAHPGTVRVLAEGEDRGFCWYAMERIDGPDLRSRLEQGPMTAAEVVELGRSLLHTLAAVHAKGFVHRDIKPGNILLAPTGPKLCDFGIARCDGSTTLTESAAVLGSLRYMAPEQRSGKSSPQSDLYSLGVVLHEALTGSAPGERALPREAPAGLRRLIRALLAEKPGQRPPDAAAALALLEHRSNLMAYVGAAAGLAVVAGIAVAIGAVGRPAAPIPLEKEPSAVVETKVAPQSDRPPVQALLSAGEEAKSGEPADAGSPVSLEPLQAVAAPPIERPPVIGLQRSLPGPPNPRKRLGPNGGLRMPKNADESSLKRQLFLPGEQPERKWAFPDGSGVKAKGMPAIRAESPEGQRRLKMAQEKVEKLKSQKSERRSIARP